ncbi:SsgA family sporulation/cell division regulator [Pseudokineococcus basanitobsidens]|uniref:SsgA family sporulation/cell division regulator n=1 Tax=Pseudokineococcus basanitobsidens TaxID=1926649 RepID=A0ABU8RHL2_9ACTN
MSPLTPPGPGRPSDVEAPVDLRLVSPDGEAVALPVVLRYTTDDPFAVTVAFGSGGDAGADVQWVFARELLLAGLEAPSGDGDVRVWPAADGRPDTTCVALSSPDGRALLEASTSDLRAFAARTLSTVPRGGEAGCMDLDAEIGHLLTA